MEMTKMIKELQEKLGEEYEIELACNEKNNGICMQGICIGRKDEKIRPTIYVRDSDSVDDVGDYACWQSDFCKSRSGRECHKSVGCGYRTDQRRGDWYHR